MPLTLRDVLDLDVVRRGEPVVLAGLDRLDVPVRWVHAAELADVGRLLRGGELLLSTGIALPDSAAGLEEFVAGLSLANVAGLAIELGRRYRHTLPDPLVAAAAARSLPLIAFGREVAFVEITESVHARIIDALLIERAATTLALGRLLAWQTESLERQAHRRLISALIGQPGALDAGSGAGLAGGLGDAPEEAAARARAMGVPVTGRRLVAAVIRIPDLAAVPGEPATVLRVAEGAAAACRSAQVPALVGALDDVRVGGLLSLPPDGDADAVLAALAGRLAATFSPGDNAPSAGLVVGVGPTAGSLAEVGDCFREAREVADVALRHPGSRAYYRLADLRLRGLVHLLRDDPRLRAFAGRELGALVAHDAAHGTTLIADLTAYLDAGGNKALAAQHAHLARPTFYQRLRLIERILGVPLGDPQSRASLHVALLALTPGP
jgi:hypothetical protein